MKKILIVDPVHEFAINELKKKFEVVYHLHPSNEEFRYLIKDVDAVVLRSGVKINKDIINAGKRLKIIARAGVGVDNIDITAAKEKNIIVFNIPNISFSSVAELTFGLMLSITRKISLADSQLKKNIWRKSELYGNELNSKSIGIVGLGRIGGRVAEIAKGFGMNIIACVKDDSFERRKALKELGIEIVSLQELLKKADIITLHVPLNEETRNLITKKELMLMKNNSFIINMSRGGVINEKDLYEILKNNIIAGAASDVFVKENEENPLFNLENFVATPHIGAMSYESQEQIAKILVKNIINCSEGKDIQNRIC